MISQKLVRLIETHARELSHAWLKEVRRDPDTPTYHTFPEARLSERVDDVFAHLGRFVGCETNIDEVERTYTSLGVERLREGFRLSEVLRALMLTKKQLWNFVLEHGFFDSVVELYQTLELYNSVVVFFDRAAFFTARGYEDEASRRAAGARPA
ncbi:MAG: RsbRD N-terminal domain-containing protein [Vicinamibacteria bacterium]|nr:RsbRD N-terminal domain-containing protein [Vicinamibacteria bacterium]